MIDHGVLFVGNFLSQQLGHAHYCEDLTRRLEARSWRIVRTSHRAGRVARILDMLHVTWRQRARYELAHVDLFSGPAFIWAEAVCFELARMHKPYVITLRGGNLPAFAERWPGRVRRVLRRAAVVTAPSPFLHDAMAKFVSHIEVVPNGLAIANYPYAMRESARPQLVWLRAFHAIYNPVMAVDVLAAVARRWPDARLLMVGPDKGDGSLAAVRTRIAELGLAEHIEIVLGVPKSDVPRFLARGDVFINTSDVDNTPVTLLEAMSCGLCIVTTSAGGIPRLVANDVDALLVPPRDTAAMTTAVERILADPRLAARLSATAHANAVRYDWSTVLARWEQLFEEVIRA